MHIFNTLLLVIVLKSLIKGEQVLLSVCDGNVKFAFTLRAVDCYVKCFILYQPFLRYKTHVVSVLKAGLITELWAWISGSFRDKHVRIRFEVGWPDYNSKVFIRENLVHDEFKIGSVVVARGG